MAVETGEVSNILTTTADVSGTVIDVGEGATQHGHCYGTSTGPLISGTKTALGVAVKGDFTSSLTGLEPETEYYVRAYCSLGGEAVYGSEISFTTKSAAPPEVTTTSITSITKTTAVGGGNVTSEGGTPVTARGVCWSLATITSITNNKTTDGEGTGIFTSDITGLTPGTNYYVRAYATNSGGTKLGNEVTFTTTPDTPVPPIVTTASVDSVTSNSAVCGGNVTNEGSSSVTARGVCWSTTVNPTIINSKTINGTGTGIFKSKLADLLPGITYYVRAYANNSAGTGYGNELQFNTLCTAPSAVTDVASGVGSATATLNGTVNANNSSTTVIFEYGLNTSYGSTITATQSPVTGSSNTAVSVTLSNLSAVTVYHYRVKATNCNPSSTYGTDQTFSTLCTLPTVAVSAATSVGSTSAVLNSAVNANGTGCTTTVTFEYGTTTLYGTSISASPSSVTGTSSTNVSATLSNLNPGTQYYYRVKAVNSGGTTCSPDGNYFTTTCPSPSAITNTAGNIENTSATLYGTVNANNCSTIVTFEYGLNTSYGSTVTAAQSPLTGSSSTSISADILGLLSGKTYHYSVKAVNSGGTVYGADATLNTTVKDKDGNTYNTVTIGSQTWMKENLKTTKLRDGTSLPNVTDINTWINLTTPAYCWYNNDPGSYKSVYGALYNWYSVNTALLCPSGWHVPTDAEWHSLIIYLDPDAILGTTESTIAGGKLKEAGLAHWYEPNGGATNSTDFTALPGGGLVRSGIIPIYSFSGLTLNGFWWVSGEYNATQGYDRLINCMEASIYRHYGRPKVDGLSVRCIRD